MSQQDSWFADDPATKTKRRDEEFDDDPLEATAIVRRQDDEMAALAAVARTAPPRDFDDIEEMARKVGRALGKILDAKGEGCRAYYRWTVSKGTDREAVVEGPTVDLMDALAGVWGGLLYEIKLLEEKGNRVVLQGKVVDLVRIVAHSRPYVGHLRSAPKSFANREDELERWKVMQLQAANSKAIRGVLEHVIPSWVVETALEAARDAASMARTGGKPLDEAGAKALENLKQLKLDVDMLTRWVGRPPAQWNAYDLQQLRDLWQRVKRGEVTVDGVRVEAANREAEREAEASEEDEPEGDGGDGDRLGDMVPKAPPTDTGKAAAKSDKPKRQSKAKGGEPKDAPPQDAGAGKGGGEPGPTRVDPASVIPPKSAGEPPPPKSNKPMPSTDELRAASSKSLEGQALLDAIKAAEADAGEGPVTRVRQQMGMPMHLNPLGVVERVGPDEARLYIVRLENAAAAGSSK